MTSSEHEEQINRYNYCTFVSGTGTRGIMSDSVTSKSIDTLVGRGGRKGVGGF